MHAEGQIGAYYVQLAKKKSAMSGDAVFRRPLNADHDRELQWAGELSGTWLAWVV